MMSVVMAIVVCGLMLSVCSCHVRVWAVVVGSHMSLS